MKTKELKNIAKQIAEAQIALESTDDQEERKKYENKIFALSKKVIGPNPNSLEDMATLDEMIQDILDKEKNKT